MARARMGRCRLLMIGVNRADVEWREEGEDGRSCLGVERGKRRVLAVEANRGSGATWIGRMMKGGKSGCCAVVVWSCVGVEVGRLLVRC